MSRDRIKVLYYTDPTAFQVFGGAEIQLLKTIEYLKRTSSRVETKLFDLFRDKLREFDILHCFQLRSECLSICKLASLEGLRVVISTIYDRWNPTFETGRGSFLGNAATKIELLLSNLRKYNCVSAKQLYPLRDLLEVADVITPTSKMEANLLSKRFNIDEKKFMPVPVGVESIFSESTPKLFMKKHGLDNFVLFVGRIERRKNVRSIIRVCKDMKLPLVIIGHANSWEDEYFQECKRVAGDKNNIHFLGSISSEELRSAYAAAKVFVLPSGWESPGMSAMEAGLAGCNLVITSVGSTKEYFGNYVSYVNPFSEHDLKRKILESYRRPKDRGLSQHLLKNFSWENTARTTLAAYNSALTD
jgi:glycosyltransferase involved in cell wall biosynthesis